MYVQYGCGLDAPWGWINFDASPRVLLGSLPFIGRKVRRDFPPNVRFGNIARGLPVPEASCEGIYCSHVLEHLTRDDCLRALVNTRRYLQPGGTFRLVVPDLSYLARKYLSDGDSFAFIGIAGPGVVSAPSGLRRLLPTSAAHLWIWDELAMRSHLEAAGFSSIRRCEFGDCEDRRFNEVERAERFVHCLSMEAHKN